MARHMRYTRRELRRRSYPFARATFGAAGALVLLGFLVALKTVLG